MPAKTASRTYRRQLGSGCRGRYHDRDAAENPGEVPPIGVAMRPKESRLGPSRMPRSLGRRVDGRRLWSERGDR